MEKRKSLSTHQKGKSAEEWAAIFLRLKGYRVLQNNFRVPQGEIDLVAQKGNNLIFVEVKSRRSGKQGSGLEAVSPLKVKRLSAAAAAYLATHSCDGFSCRFDVITLGPDKNWFKFPKIAHLQNAFPAVGNFNV